MKLYKLNKAIKYNKEIVKVKIINTKGSAPTKINDIMNSKLDNELKMMKAVNVIASEFNVKILEPLLSAKFIEYAKTIPISEKIHSSDDLYRKHIIRKLASDIGVPEVSCSKRKKALQYGSKIHKFLLKTR